MIAWLVATEDDAYVPIQNTLPVTGFPKRATFAMAVPGVAPEAHEAVNLAVSAPPDPVLVTEVFTSEVISDVAYDPGWMVMTARSENVDVSEPMAAEVITLELALC